MSRTFDSFREPKETKATPDEEEIGRILATEDGEKLLRLLKKRTDRVFGEDASAGALLALNAERRLVAQLERLYAAGRRIDTERARARLWGYPEQRGGAPG